jgi:glutamyl-tRNA reductase
MRRTRSDGTRTIGIAGASRVAQALGRFLIQRGERVVAIAGRNPERTARAARFIGPAARPTAIQELPDVSSHVLISRYAMLANFVAQPDGW